MNPQMKRANQLIAVCVMVIFGMLLVANVAKAQNEVGFSQGYVIGWKAGSV